LRPLSRARKAAVAGVALAAAGAATFWMLTVPRPLEPSEVPAREPDLANGERLYHAGSCISCHRPPKASPGADPALPSGGAPFATPVGTFFPQNLTPDAETGLGRFTPADFVNAMTRGLSPSGRHYFPAFPYASYRNVRVEDLLDLYGYLRSLPAVRSPERRARVPFERIARRGVGLWDRLALRGPVFEPDPARGASWNRGAYLVEGIGHCAECHTPRDRLRILDRSRHMAGGPHPSGEGQVPGLRSLVERGRYRDADDLALALGNGETLGYDRLSSGGMGEIQENLSHLPEEDLRAIAEYLASLK
jgi:mono/diheme cytochrome c family protein